MAKYCSACFRKNVVENRKAVFDGIAQNLQTLEDMSDWYFACFVKSERSFEIVSYVAIDIPHRTSGFAANTLQKPFKFITRYGS